MGSIGFSWAAFWLYLGALTLMVGGGFYGLLESNHPAFLAPILMGLFYFYICWEAVVEDSHGPPPSAPDR